MRKTERYHNLALFLTLLHLSFTLSFLSLLLRLFPLHLLSLHPSSSPSTHLSLQLLYSHHRLLYPHHPFLPHNLPTTQPSLRRLTPPSTPLEHLTLSLCIRTDVLDRSSIPIVRIDAYQQISILCCYAFNVDVAFALLGAIATAAVQFAVVFDVLHPY
jgi:hypothetical protein